MKNIDLNERLKQIHSAQTIPTAQQAAESSAQPQSSALVPAHRMTAGLSAYHPMSLASEAIPVIQTGLVGRLASGVQNIRNLAAKAKLKNDTQLALLGHQVEAVTRESDAFWRAKSAELAEVMNAYLQEHLLAIETTRMDNMVKALDLATARITERLRAIESADYPDFLKQQLLEAAYSQYQATCERIKKEVLIQKYQPAKC